MAFLGFGGNSNAPSVASSSPSTTTSSPQSQQIKEQLFAKVQQEIATANATTLVNSLTENCYNLCIFKPSSSLTSAESKCIDDCSTKYMRSWNLVSKSYIARINSN